MMDNDRDQDPPKGLGDYWRPLIFRLPAAGAKTGAAGLVLRLLF